MLAVCFSAPVRVLYSHKLTSENFAGPALLASKIHEVLGLLEREQFPLPNHPRSGEISNALQGLKSMALAHVAPPAPALRQKQDHGPPLDPSQQQQPPLPPDAQEMMQEGQALPEHNPANTAPPLGQYQLMHYFMNQNMRMMMQMPAGVNKRRSKAASKAVSER